MIISLKCPKCGSVDDNLFSILGYTNAFKKPERNNGTILASVLCESCKTEFEALVRKPIK